MADINQFLKLIQAMESSGGKDINHKTLKSGIHEGDTAIGEFALMPNTAKELAGAKAVGPSDDVIRNLPNDQVESLLKENPDLTEQYVRQLAGKLMETTKGDPTLGMVGYRFGHNKSLPEIEATAKRHPDYTEKVGQRIDENNLQSQMSNLFNTLPNLYKDLPMSKKRK